MVWVSQPTASVCHLPFDEQSARGVCFGIQVKFRNLHIYGCWWYCNVPSLIESITTLRVKMLGTSFTVQHSDARVLDQLRSVQVGT